MKTILTQLTQPTKFSCVTTCLAMLLGHDIPDGVVAKYHPQFFSGAMSVYQIMDELGIQYRRPQRSKEHELKKGKTYLVSVPSLNISGGLHQVIFQITQSWNIVVFDPAQGRKGRRFYQSTHRHIGDNCQHPLTWNVDAEILGIEPIVITAADEIRGTMLTAKRNEEFMKEHTYDFQDFLDKLDRPEEDNYDLAP